MLRPSPKKVGVAPTIEAIDEYLTTSLGLQRTVMGQSHRGRDLIAYASSSTDPVVNSTSSPVLLLLSLAHGNEPMGLLSLLDAAWALTNSLTTVRVVLLPVVNPDAYVLNLQHGKGCRRTNLRSDLNCTGPETEACSDQHPTLPCPTAAWTSTATTPPTGSMAPPGATDVTTAVPTPSANRRRRPYGTPSPGSTYPTPVSFHTRRAHPRPDLIVHPYTSNRGFDTMDPGRRRRYRRWIRGMNSDGGGGYVTGTAMEAIQYTAGGSSIDWFESVGVYAFIVEVSPPCEQRWCDDGNDVFDTARRHGEMVVGFASEISESRKYLPHINQNSRMIRDKQARVLEVMVVVGAAVVFFFMAYRSFYRWNTIGRVGCGWRGRYITKEPAPDDTELQNLVAAETIGAGTRKRIITYV